MCLCGTAAAAPKARLVLARDPGAESCPGSSLLRERVSARLGYDPFADDAKKEVAITFSRTGGFRAVIALFEGGKLVGSRELVTRGRDCGQLARSVELALALAIDPLLFAAAPVEAEPGVTVNERAGTKVGASTSAIASESVSTKLDLPALRVRLGAGVLAALGGAPGVNAGFTLQLGLRGLRWSLGFEGRADLPSSQAAYGGTVSTALYTVSVIPCFHVNIFGLCAILALGGQVSRSEGFPIEREASTFYGAGGLRASLAFLLKRKLELQVNVDTLAAFTRATLFADMDIAYRNTPISGALQLALFGYFR
jgi:hypothetical protein